MLPEVGPGRIERRWRAGRSVGPVPPLENPFFAAEPPSHEPGDYEAWELWEIPDCAAIDRYVRTEARRRFLREYAGPGVGDPYERIATRRVGCSGRSPPCVLLRHS